MRGLLCCVSGARPSITHAPHILEVTRRRRFPCIGRITNRDRRAQRHGRPGPRAGTVDPRARAWARGISIPRSRSRDHDPGISGLRFRSGNPDPGISIPEHAPVDPRARAWAGRPIFCVSVHRGGGLGERLGKNRLGERLGKKPVPSCVSVHRCLGLRPPPPPPPAPLSLSPSPPRWTWLRLGRPVAPGQRWPGGREERGQPRRSLFT